MQILARFHQNESYGDSVNIQYGMEISWDGRMSALGGADSKPEQFQADMR